MEKLKEVEKIKSILNQNIDEIEKKFKTIEQILMIKETNNSMIKYYDYDKNPINKILKEYKNIRFFEENLNQKFKIMKTPVKEIYFHYILYQMIETRQDVSLY